MNIIISSCRTCPLFNGWETYCTHPNPAPYIDNSDTTPKDCPLKTGSITISYKGK